MSDLRMELIQGQLNDIEENVRSIKATWGNTITTLDNIKTSLKADRQKAIDEAYQKGFEAGQHEATTLEYQQGLDDAWECAKRIVLIKTNENSPYFTVDELIEIFGYSSLQSVLDTYSASEAIEKVKAYEKQQKADEIKVGDEVCFVFAGGKTIEPFIVFSIKDDNGKKYYEGIQTSDGRWVSGGLKYYKTGRHFSQVEKLLKAMKGEQSCLSCEYSNDPDGVRCRDCCGFEKWEPKEGE